MRLTPDLEILMSLLATQLALLAALHLAAGDVPQKEGIDDRPGQRGKENYIEQDKEVR
jgi:hypothetical protein